MKDSIPRALVTGGSSGIGRELVLGLDSRGWQVDFCGRNADGLDETARHTNSAMGFQCDLALHSDTLKLVRELAARGSLNLLVNNAGSFQPGLLESQDASMIAREIQINLVAPLQLLSELLRADLLSRGSRIITILSVAANTVFSGSSIYGGAKAGLAQAMNVVREELREKGILVCNVHPGATLTPAWGEQGQKLAEKLMPAESLARIILDSCLGDPRVLVEELVLRPPTGDL